MPAGGRQNDELIITVAIFSHLKHLMSTIIIIFVPTHIWSMVERLSLLADFSAGPADLLKAWKRNYSEA
jgi:hypothetical protein